MKHMFALDLLQRHPLIFQKVIGLSNPGEEDDHGGHGHGHSHGAARRSAGGRAKRWTNRQHGAKAANAAANAWNDEAGESSMLVLIVQHFVAGKKGM